MPSTKRSTSSSSKSTSGSSSSKPSKGSPPRASKASHPVKTKTSATGARPKQNDNPIPNPATERARNQQRAEERQSQNEPTPARTNRFAQIMQNINADQSVPDKNYGRRTPSVPSGSTGSTNNTKRYVSHYDKWARDVYAGIAPGQDGRPVMTMAEADRIRRQEEAKQVRRRRSRKQTPK